MPIIYKTYQSNMKNKQGLKLFHPRAVCVGTVNTEQIAREISEYSSLSKGDAKNVLDNLVTVMTKHLQASEAVSIDGLGTFRITIVSGGKGVEKDENVSPTQASLRVRFAPAFTRRPNQTVATRSLVDGVRLVPYASVITSGAGKKPADAAGQIGGGQGAEGGTPGGVNPLD